MEIGNFSSVEKSWGANLSDEVETFVSSRFMSKG